MEDVQRELNIAEILDSDDEVSDLSSDSSSQEGGSGYKVKSYHINRLKAYDPELFIFKSEKWQKNKKGEKTSRYGYPKVCTASKEQKRQPIVVTKEELHIIDASSKKGSGRAGTSKKKQGYNARLDESLGMRRGKASSKKQGMKARRDES